MKNLECAFIAHTSTYLHLCNLNFYRSDFPKMCLELSGLIFCIKICSVSVIQILKDAEKWTLKNNIFAIFDEAAKLLLMLT